MSPEKKYMDKLFKEYMLPDRFPLIAVSTFLAGYFFGEDGLAAFSFMLPIYFLFIVAGFGINFGAFSLAVDAVSKSQSEVAQKYSTAALKLSIAVGLILAVAVNVFFWQIVEFEHVPPNLYPLRRKLREKFDRLRIFSGDVAVPVAVLEINRLAESAPKNLQSHADSERRDNFFVRENFRHGHGGNRSRNDYGGNFLLAVGRSATSYAAGQKSFRASQIFRHTDWKNSSRGQCRYVQQNFFAVSNRSVQFLHAPRLRIKGRGSLRKFANCNQNLPNGFRNDVAGHHADFDD